MSQRLKLTDAVNKIIVKNGWNLSLLLTVLLLPCLNISLAAKNQEKITDPLFPSEELNHGLDLIWSAPKSSKAITPRLSSLHSIKDTSTKLEAKTVRLQNLAVLVYPNFRIHQNQTIPQSEMSVATHPINRDLVLVGANTWLYSSNIGSQGWYYTPDGDTWTGSDTLPSHTPLTDCMGDPTVAIDLDGIFHFSALRYPCTPGGRVVLAQSTNNGTSWSQNAISPIGIVPDKPYLTVDLNSSSAYKNYLYLAYSNYTNVPYDSNPIVFQRSTDRGTTFSSPVQISDTVGTTAAQGVNLAAGPNGELYATWSGYNAGFFPSTSLLGFNKSTDGGASWQTAQGIRYIGDLNGQIWLIKGPNRIRVRSWPSMAVDRSTGPRRGWIYIVYASPNPTTPDIFLIRSTDGGSSWSNPQKVNQDNSGKDQWFPWIAVDPTTGNIYVVYFDSRNFTPNDSAQVYISSSQDGGVTFEDVLVSDAAFLPAPLAGFEYPGTGYSGDYIGISALCGVVWPCWNDNRTGIHQAYVSRMVYSTPTPPLSSSLLLQRNGSIGDQLGYVVDGAGDINNDGKADFIAGAPRIPNGIGSVYVFSGADGSIIHQVNGVAEEWFGINLAGVGEINGDRKPDFIVGSPLADPGGVINSGSVYVYSGADGGLIYQLNGTDSERFGSSVDGVGDVNGDGKGDFIVGAPRTRVGGLSTAGSVFVYSGINGTVLYRRDGTFAFQQLGTAVGGVGDANFDGKADFIIGDPLASPNGLSHAGSAYVYSGANGSLLYQKDGTIYEGHFGNSVAGVGDINGDGRNDFAISNDSGLSLIYSGADGNPLYTLTGVTRAIGAGDVNADGNDDFFVRVADTAYVYSGFNGAFLFRVNGVKSGAGMGDVNVDCRADIVFGNPDFVPSGKNKTGAAFIYGLGPTPPPPPPPPCGAVAKLDIDHDNVLDVPDIVLFLKCVFLGEGQNCNDEWTLSDLFILLNSVFSSASIPVPC
ncbi:MAG TPA: hypothetical protein VNL73_10055 [Verrucomicrobiae bacterium]|nr:hypothetical protein [Verrucomicrobiae bacterium]